MDELKAKKSGFLIIEAIMAMAIIIITFSAAILVNFGDQNFIIGGKTNAEALNKAQELLEKAQTLARKDFRAVNPIAATADGIYEKQLDVGPSSSTNDYFSKLVKSRVSWTDDGKITRLLELSSLVSDFENTVGGDTCNSFLTGNWTNPQTTVRNFADIVEDSSGEYPITDIDVYLGKLYATINSPSIDSGAINPSSVADDGTIGTLIWWNPNMATTEDDSNATAEINGVAVTHYLKAGNFGFDIPKGATILGIRVSILRIADGNSADNAVIDSRVSIVKADGSIGSANKASGIRWSAISETNASYGGTADLWDETTLSPEDINNPNFGVVLAVTGVSESTNRIASVDNMRITITYIKEFYIFDVSNKTDPILIAGLGSNADIATGFNAIAVDGKYAYVATNSGVKQFQIIDIDSTPPTVIGSLEIPDEHAVGRTIFYRNGYAYLGLEIADGNEFNIIDVHNPSDPKLIGGFPIGRTVNAIYVRGNYAFIAKTVSNGSPEMFVVLDISNPANPFKVSGFNDFSGLGGHGKSLFAVGDALYLGRTATNISGAADALPEFYALDKNNLDITPPVLGSLPLLSSGDSVNALLIRDYLAFLLTNKQIQIMKINEGSPWTFSQYATSIILPNSGAGIAFDCEGNYLYSASVPESGEFTNKSSISITTAI